MVLHFITRSKLDLYDYNKSLGPALEEVLAAIWNHSADGYYTDTPAQYEFEYNDETVTVTIDRKTP